jgi:Rad3-related DNA helicase
MFIQFHTRSVTPSPAPPSAGYRISVRELCAFAAKSGSLDLRFTPSPSAAQGMAGHRTVARRRGPGRRSELPLQLDYRGLSVRGRADGFDEAAGLLEEVKTHRGAVERIPANHQALHWAQAKVYGWMLCRQLGLPRLRVSVVYFDVDSELETPQTQTLEAAQLQSFFEALCERFIAWSQQEQAHRVRRDAALRALAWPHPGYRAGQRELAEAVYHAVRGRHPLLAQAPTGIGKTLATLFPMLKAMPGHASCAPLDKVFFLTARTTGRQLAVDALALLKTADAREPALRVLTLVARDKACEHPDKTCQGDACPLARDFYERLPAARAEAVAGLTPGSPALRSVALRHQVCPYYLAQEMARWADVVVADYNYVFDQSALLHALTVENDWKTGVLVDEAHNLAPRARDMYTAELSSAGLRAARKLAPAGLRPALDRLRRAWSAVTKAQAEPYRVHDEVPPRLLEALRQWAGSVGDALAEDPASVTGELLQLHFDALAFASLAEAMDHHSQFDISRLPPAPGRRARADSLLCVRCIVPAPFLEGRFGATQSTVLFSATLAPAGYHRAMLGLPPTTAWIDVASPFHAEQLAVHVAGDISTRFADRAASLAPLARLIAGQYQRQPGNYLAFFSSFDYLEQVASALAATAPEIPLRLQQRRMAEAERSAFVDSFASGGAQVGLVVLGGAFGEGIDLPGSRLIGAFVATLGLPQLNPVNEAMKRRLHGLFGDGYAYAYLYPGLQRVVQAAGRVIRTPQDRGVLHLIDDRFQRASVKALLPSWWRFQPPPAAGPG